MQALQNCHSQPELDAQIQKIFSPLGGTIETWLNNQFGKIHANGKIPVNVNALSSNAHSTQNKLADVLTNKVKNLFKNKDNLKQALLLGRQMKIPGLKGRWEKTLGNWAGKAAIAVQVLTFLHDTHKAHAEQERMNQENRQQSVELYQAAEQVGDAVASSFITSTQDLLRQSFDGHIDDITQQLDQYQQQKSALKSDYDSLLQLRAEMMACQFG